MVSEFRRKKLLELFTYYDTDKNGTIEKGGFELAIKEINKARGFQPGDAKYKEVENTLLNIWEGIQKDGDSDSDGKISADEWIAMWEKFAKNPTSPLDWQSQYCKFVFSLLDVSNDGKIDSEEFCSLNESFGISKDVATASFQKMSKGKGSVSWSEFEELYREYFTTDDPNAPGNFIFCTTS